MKNIIYFLSSTLMVVIIYSSCLKNEKVQPNFIISEATEIIENFNIGKLAHQKARHTIGTVEIVTTDKEVVLFITENGKQDLMYILQQIPTKDSKEIRGSISNAQILFFHRGLLINDIDNGARFFFTIDKETPPYLEKMDLGSIYIGYGLARQKGISLRYQSINDFHDIPSIYDIIVSPDEVQVTARNNDAFMIIAKPTCKCCTAGDPTSDTCVSVIAGDCDGGGAGSGSCSLSSDGDSCSVECTSGDGACCKYNNDN